MAISNKIILLSSSGCPRRRAQGGWGAVGELDSEKRAPRVCFFFSRADHGILSGAYSKCECCQFRYYQRSVAELVQPKQAAAFGRRAVFEGYRVYPRLLPAAAAVHRQPPAASHTASRRHTFEKQRQEALVGVATGRH